MDNQRKKWVNLSFGAIAALLGFVLFSLAFKLAGQFDLEAKIPQIDWMIRLGSLVIAMVTFIILLKNPKSSQFMDEVVLEVTRVTWPPEKDSARATIVVVIMVLIAGLVLGGMDVFLTWVMKTIL